MTDIFNYLPALSFFFVLEFFIKFEQEFRIVVPEVFEANNYV